MLSDLLFKDGEKTIVRIETDEVGYYLVYRDGASMVHIPYDDTHYDVTRMLIHYSRTVDNYLLGKAIKNRNGA